MTTKKATCFRLFIFCIAALLIGSASVGIPRPADAQGGLRAKIFLLTKSIPRKLPKHAILNFVRQHDTTRLMETRKKGTDQRYWKANLVAMFNQPIRDLEFELLFYDTQGDKPRFIAPATVFVSDRMQKTIVHKLRLKQPEFKPNRRTQMVVTVRRQEVARHSFQILGEAVQHQGEVTFSTDETR